MAKTSHVPRRGLQLRTRAALNVKRADPVPQLRRRIDRAFGTRKSNPCVIKHCPAKHGHGVFARHDLKKGAIVAYCVQKLHKKGTHTSPTRGVYITEAPASPRRPLATSRTFQGDIGQDAGDTFGRYVFRGKPVCGHLINEPSEVQTENCHMPTTVWDAKLLKCGSASRAAFQAGDVLFHEVRTFRTVKKNEELVTVYGDSYKRNYKVGKKFAKS